MFINRKMVIIQSLVMVLFLVSCGAQQDLRMETPASKAKYTIGPEDVLAIYVYKQPDFSVNVPVRIDGKISLPLINDIQAAGLTPEQLKDDIAKKLSKYIQEPTVSVMVTAANSLKVYVNGNVNSPGVYPIGSQLNIVQVISLAGGLTDWANAKKIKIFRKEGNAEKILEINYSDIVNAKAKQNILVYPGDTIIVP